MPDAVKISSWQRQFKTHNKVKKRLMTGAEAAEKDADKREQVTNREAQLQAPATLLLTPQGLMPHQSDEEEEQKGGPEQERGAEQEEEEE